MSARSASKPANWWYSADGKRGFCWSSVVGYDYKPAGTMGFDKSTLYLYVSSGLLHLHGAEADEVAKTLLSDRPKPPAS